MIEAVQVKKKFRLGTRDIEVLRGVDLQIEAGHVTAIQGASGAGKSTLLHILGALDKPSEGEVLFEGRPLSEYSPSGQARLRNLRFGFIFQSYQLLPELDALENVMLPAVMAGRHDPERARILLEDVGLSHRASHKPGELSGGEQQRVAIARALVNDPDIIFADEPTGNLDSENGMHVVEILLRLAREKKKTLLMVTHDPAVARQADIHVHMIDGRIAR